MKTTMLVALAFIGIACEGTLISPEPPAQAPEAPLGPSRCPGCRPSCADLGDTPQALARCRRPRRPPPADAEVETSDGGMAVIEVDSGSPPPPPVDAGSPPPPPPPPPVDAGSPPPPPPPPPCVEARRLWSDGFDSGDYVNWTNRSYARDWGTSCQDNAVSTVAHSGAYSNRSEITCASHTDVHRGYGGVQFSGDSFVPFYTNSGTGTEAPNGVVNTFWLRLDTPYVFGAGRWLSLWTTNGDCAWSERVLTLGLEDASMRLTPAHVRDTGGTVTFSPGAPSFPRGVWVRVTVYVNYHSGEMHVWQDGASVVHATFSRPSTDICQWHWGAYASGNNDDVVLFEDDNSIWKLEERWSDWSVEPWMEGGAIRACSP